MDNMEGEGEEVWIHLPQHNFPNDLAEKLASGKC